MDFFSLPSSSNTAPMDSNVTNNALKAIANGMSVRQAAKTFRLSRYFIRGRLRGRPLRRDAQSSLQSITPAQELFLVNWVLLQARLGWEPPRNRFRLFAQCLFAASGGQTTLGKDWHTRFFKRWPATKSLNSPSKNVPRITSSSWTNTLEFFDRLDHPLLANIPPSRTYTVDEFGSMIGHKDNAISVGPASVRKMFTTDHGVHEPVTIMECISGDGRALKPLVIFRGVKGQQQCSVNQVDRKDFENWSFEASPSGYISSQIALHWLENIFLPLTKPADGGWRHLILHDHASHTDEDFVLACFKEKVWLHFFPANTSHMLQPLALSPFLVLKRTYQDRLLEHSAAGLSVTSRVLVFLDAWNESRKKAFLPQNIQAGWLAAGIFPRDCSRALRNRQAQPNCSGQANARRDIADGESLG